MSFFSWFRSKSEKSEQDELELQHSNEVPETHSDTEPQQVHASRVPPPRLRETVPGNRLKPASAADSASSPKEGFRRPVRATVDVPLQALLQQLPTEITKSDIDIDPKRRVQIPRKTLQIDDAHQTATVTFAALFASCPDIFSVPIAPSDQRTLQFNLPAWERSLPLGSIGRPGATTTQLEPVSGDTTPPPVQTQGKSEDSGTTLPGRLTPPRPAPLPAQKQLAAELEPTSEAATGGAQNGAEASKTVRVALGPIIKNLPAELQPSDPAALANKPGATVELPFELINPQLAHGRVTIPYSTLLRSLPEEAKAHFPQADAATEVPIPIKEILQDYPQDLLRPRSDQEPEEVLPVIPTPFTGPAQEDTERFSQVPPEAEVEEKVADGRQLELIEPPATIVESPQAGAPEVSTVPEEKPEPVAEEKPAVEQKPEPNFSALQSVFLTDDPLDLKKVVQKVGEFPGVNSALFFGPDGSVEGDPEKLGLTQPSVQLLSSLTHEIGQRVEGLGFGKIETITLGWKRELMSVFTRGEAGFVVRHEKRPFKPGVREKICLVLSHISN
jgi:hypothetical protein